GELVLATQAVGIRGQIVTLGIGGSLIDDAGVAQNHAVIVHGLVEADQLECVGQIVGRRRADTIALATADVFLDGFIGKRAGERAVGVVERHAERVGVFVLNGSLALVYRVRQL